MGKPIAILLLILLLLLIFSECKAAGEEVEAGVEEQPTPNTAPPDHEGLKIYQHLLKLKRGEQSAAVKSVLKVPDKKKQRKLLDDLFTVITQSLSDCREAIFQSKQGVEELRLRLISTGSGANSPNTSSPDDSNSLKEMISRTVENTALLGEFALFFPDYTSNRLKRDEELHTLFKWAYQFAHDLSVFDASTLEMLNLAGQELQLIPRQSNYSNPYSRAQQKEELQRQAAEAYKKAQAERKLKEKEKGQGRVKSKKGPSLSAGRIEL